jgi:hypothetical protein
MSLQGSGLGKLTGESVRTDICAIQGCLKCFEQADYQVSKHLSSVIDGNAGLTFALDDFDSAVWQFDYIA